MDFGGGPLASTADRMVLAKFDPAGSHIWSQCYGDSGDWQWPNSMTTDAFDNLIVTGMFKGVLDFGDNHLSSIESEDAFLAKFGNTVVPAQLQSYTAAHTRAGLEVKWHLADGDPGLDFFILRADAANKRFARLDRPNIFRQDLVFTFIDNSIEPGRTYIYRIGVTDKLGERILFETDPVAMPRLNLSLGQSFPNPFNPQTTFSYSIPKTGMVSLKVYDAQGRYIRILHEAPKAAGRHVQTWDGRDDSGTVMGSGVYFIRLQYGGQSQSRKVVLIK